MTIAERAYRVLLRLYPRAFRDAMGEELIAFQRERLREARAHGDSIASVWARAIIDVITSAVAEWATTFSRHSRRDPYAPESNAMSRARSQLHLAVRALARRPGFTAIVLATLALGIGANAAIFSVVNGILLRPLPFRAPERVAFVTLDAPYSQISEPELMDIRRDVRAFASVAAYSTTEVNVTNGAEPNRIGVALVSDQFFGTVGTAPALGRAFTADEERRGGPRAVVISDALWRQYLGGAADAVGRTLHLGSQAYVVVGVMPPRFDYPNTTIDAWRPMRLDPDSLDPRNNHTMLGVARLAPGATFERARAEMATLATRWQRDFPGMYFPDRPVPVRVQAIRESIVGDTRPFVLALMGAVGFVLLIACVNVANLLLTRGEARRRELAIRAALGASRRQLADQVLAEGLLLALGGGALGLLAAWLATRALLAVAPSTIPRLDEIGIDPLVLGFTAGVSILTGLLAALVPALRAARCAPADPLRASGKGTVASASTRHTRGALVVAQVALAVVTLAGAGLMLRSLWMLQATDLGFAPNGLLTARVSPADTGYGDARTRQLWRDLVTRAAALPGVRGAAATAALPIANETDGRWTIFVDGRTGVPVSQAPWAKPMHVTPEYFDVMRIPVKRGRALLATDREDAPAVTVVNEAMARQLWPGADPLGRTIRLMGGTQAWATVVGVVGDVRSSGFQEDAPPTFYVPHAQGAASGYYIPRAMTVVLRTSGDATALAGVLRATLRAGITDASITDVRTMDRVVATSIASRRFSTTLLGVFACVALVLAAIGIYGVIAYSVSQRTYEIGLRMALGAQRRGVLALVLGEGMRLAGAGLVLGLVTAAALTRLVRSLLVDVSALDPATFATVALGLLAVGVLASVLPARRATLVRPTEALRGE